MSLCSLSCEYQIIASLILTTFQDGFRKITLHHLDRGKKLAQLVKGFPWLEVPSQKDIPQALSCIIHEVHLRLLFQPLKSIWRFFDNFDHDISWQKVWVICHFYASFSTLFCFRLESWFLVSIFIVWTFLSSISPECPTCGQFKSLKHIVHQLQDYVKDLMAKVRKFFRYYLSFFIRLLLKSYLTWQNYQINDHCRNHSLISFSLIN